MYIKLNQVRLDTSFSTLTTLQCHILRVRTAGNCTGWTPLTFSQTYAIRATVIYKVRQPYLLR